jgi:hypothetical protein
MVSYFYFSHCMALRKNSISAVNFVDEMMNTLRVTRTKPITWKMKYKSQFKFVLGLGCIYHVIVTVQHVLVC